jgi:class 3 adenylate cyclase
MPDPPTATTAAATALPTGTVTFLMSDIEGSTRLLQALGDRYAAVLDDHYRILNAHGSREEKIDVRSERLSSS